MQKAKIALAVLVCLGVVTLSVLFALNANFQVLNPMGWVARQERDLIVTAFVLMLIVVVPVIYLTFHIAWKYRASNQAAKYEPEWDQDLVAEAVWWGLPCLIVAVLSVILWKSSHQLDPFKPLDSDVKPVRIQVVALQWKWLFIYPEEGIATVNYVQFPEQTPVNFEITADAPMNSFWIPQLGGQIYAMPAMRTKLHLIASQVGRYRGCSSNLSGKGFAGMTFAAVSSTQEDYESWVEQVRGNEPLDSTSYERLAEPSEYNPVALYELGQDDLFDAIVMKYMMPMDGK